MKEGSKPLTLSSHMWGWVGRISGVGGVGRISGVGEAIADVVTLRSERERMCTLQTFLKHRSQVLLATKGSGE